MHSGQRDHVFARLRLVELEDGPRNSYASVEREAREPPGQAVEALPERLRGLTRGAGGRGLFCFSCASEVPNTPVLQRARGHLAVGAGSSVPLLLS